MSATRPTQLRLTPGDRAALDAIAADMGVDRTTAVRKLVYEETERRGITGHAAAAFIARLIETYHANAAVKVVTDGGNATIRISGEEPAEAQAVLLVAGVEGDELRIEDPEGPASIVIATMATGQSGELHWEGTLADLAAIVPQLG